MKNVPTQVSSIVATLIGLVAVIHPGFHVTVSIQQIVILAVTSVVIVLQSLHLHVSGKVIAAFSAERAAVNSVLATMPKPQATEPTTSASMADVMPTGSPDLHL